MSKHLLYLTNTQLSACIWDKGVLSTPHVFDNYASGWAKFTEYLDVHKDLPTYLLTDLIEEDFQLESIPHVFGKAKKALIDRRLNNLYRDTPYRSARQQGREKEGRRDDKMLFSALTNAQLIKPWVDALDVKKINVTGVYSVALLSSIVFKKLNLKNEATLLVTHQSSGLRQSFFKDGYLRFSRLSPETAWSPETIAEMINAEMAKTRQFLVSTRLINRNENITMVVVSAKDIIEHLQPLSQNIENLFHQFINLYEAKRSLGLDKLTELNLCDPLFLSLLASQRVPAHYATAEQHRLMLMAQTKIGLNFMSVLTVSIALFLTADAGIDAYNAMQLTKQAKIETQLALSKYQATVSSMPVTVVNPKDMKVAVELQKMLIENGPVPNIRWQMISNAMVNLPQIKIHEIKWKASEVVAVGGEANPEALPPEQLENAPISAELLGIGKNPDEIIELEAEITPFKNDYRTALDVVNEFIRELKKDAHLQVELVKPPIDIRPSVALTSESGNDENLLKPKFNLKLVWRQ